jgi:hypothetical protein
MPRRYISRSRWAKFLGSRRPVEKKAQAIWGDADDDTDLETDK